MEKNNSFIEKAQRKERTLQEQLNSVIEYVSSDLDAPSLYVGTYGKYNAGSIFGAWLDLTMFDSYDEFIEVCQKLHADEEDPELMFQDYSCIPHCLYSESCMSEKQFEHLLEYVQMDDSEQPAYEAYLDNFDHDASVEDFRDHYDGDFDSEEEFAEQMAHEIWPNLDNESWGMYFDYEAYARDLFLQDYDFEDGHVFHRY